MEGDPGSRTRKGRGGQTGRQLTPTSRITLAGRRSGPKKNKKKQGGRGFRRAHAGAGVTLPLTRGSPLRPRGPTSSPAGRNHRAARSQPRLAASSSIDQGREGQSGTRRDTGGSHRGQGACTGRRDVAGPRRDAAVPVARAGKASWHGPATADLEVSRAALHRRVRAPPGCSRIFAVAAPDTPPPSSTRRAAAPQVDGRCICSRHVRRGKADPSRIGKPRYGASGCERAISRAR